MKQIDIVIHTTPADYTGAAALFKQLGMLLSAKLKSQVRIIGMHHDCPAAETGTGDRVQVNGRAVPPDPGRIIDEVRRQLYVRSNTPCVRASAA